MTTTQQYIQATTKLLPTLPPLVTEFYEARFASGSQATSLHTTISKLNDFFTWYGFSKHVTPRSLTLAEIKSVSVQDINRYIINLQNKVTNRGKPMSKVTITGNVNALRSWYRWLTVESSDPDNYPKAYLDFNPMSKVNWQIKKATIASQASEVEKRIYPGEQKFEFLDWLEQVYKPSLKPGAKKLYQLTEVRNNAIIALLFASGLRVTELVNIDITDLNNVEHTVYHVTRKGDHQDTVDYAGWAEPYLDKWLELRNSNPVFDQDNHALFVSQKAEQTYRISQTQVERMFKKLTTAYGKPATPHKARHTFGTEIYNATKSVLAVQEALGQTTDSATKIYIHNSNIDRKSIIEDL